MANTTIIQSALLRKEAKASKRKVIVWKDIVAVDGTTEIQFKDEAAQKAWNRWANVWMYEDEYGNEDPIGARIVLYARYWAKYMQHLMKKHDKAVADVARSTSSILEEFMSVKGWEHQLATKVLTECWEYGEELYKCYAQEGWIDILDWPYL